MKKILKFTLFIIMILSIALSSFACGDSGKKPTPTPTPPEELTPIGEAAIKIGVISDAQLEVGMSETASNYAAPEHFRKALTYYKAQKIDMLVMVGDMVNNAKQTSYDLYNSVLNEIYPVGSRPEILFNVGNHERFTGDNTINNSSLTEKAFKDNTGEELRSHKKVKGYSFITIDTSVYDSANNLTKGATNYLKAELAKANADANGKPIFVAIHPPIAGTTYGSWGNSDSTSQSATVSGIMDDYPNAVLFTGHCHYPLADERSIHQKLFTTINTGSICYTCLGAKNDEGKIANSAKIEFDNVMTDGSFRPKKNEVTNAFSHDVAHGLIVKAYSNATTFDRINFLDGNKTFGEQWIIPTNITKEDFTYTEDRSENSQAPTWSENTAATAVKSGLTIDVNFSNANPNSSPIESYVVSVSQIGSSKTEDAKCIVSDYYMGLGDTSRYQVLLSLNESSKKYRVSIVAYNCFGKASEPLEVEISNA